MSPHARLKTARRIMARLDQNALDLYSGRIAWPKFQARARRAWARAHRAGVRDVVLSLVTGRDREEAA